MAKWRSVYKKTGWMEFQYGQNLPTLLPMAKNTMLVFTISM